MVGENFFFGRSIKKGTLKFLPLFVAAGKKRVKLKCLFWGFCVRALHAVSSGFICQVLDGHRLKYFSSWLNNRELFSLRGKKKKHCLIVPLLLNTGVNAPRMHWDLITPATVRNASVQCNVNSKAFLATFKDQLVDFVLCRLLDKSPKHSGFASDKKN